MTAPSAAAGDISGALSDIRHGVDEAAEGVRDIVNGVNTVLDLLPEITVAAIRADVAQLQRMLEDATRRIGEMLAYAGDPAALRAAGSAWATTIGGASSRLAGFATLNGVRADDYWTGRAATAYRNTLPAQQAALIAIKQAGDEVDATLNELAGAITTFWVSLGLALVALVFAIVSAAAGAGSVIGAPIGAGLAMAALAAFVVLFETAVNSFTTMSTGSAARSAELERRLSNDTAFPGGDWPRSATPISGDGSITDGDGTDWHVVQ